MLNNRTSSGRVFAECQYTPMIAFHRHGETVIRISIELPDRGEAESKPIYKYFNIINQPSNNQFEQHCKYALHYRKVGCLITVCKYLCKRTCFGLCFPGTAFRPLGKAGRQTRYHFHCLFVRVGLIYALQPNQKLIPWQLLSLELLLKLDSAS